MTIFKAYNNTKRELESASIEDYVFEAKQIIKHVTGLSSSEILMHYNNNLSEFQMNNLTALIKQRLARYPLQYIFGEWGFYGNNFKVGPGVLVPRADTETLIDVCKDCVKDVKSPAILDLCSGSGCIGITLAKELPGSNVTMVEKYKEAMTYAEQNVKLNNTCNVKLVIGDVFEGCESDKKFDLIVSNPPYIPADEMETISPETKYEPDTALYGGEDGMIFYRAILQNYRKCLNINGTIAFEVGINEDSKVESIMKDYGFDIISKKKDLNDIQRVVYGKLCK